MRLVLSFLLFFVYLPVYANEQLIIEADQGREPILSFIKSAHSQIDVVMYGLTDQAFTNTFISEQSKGKKVRILLEKTPYKAVNENKNAIASLEASGINWQPANPAYKLTHQKTIIIDNQRALIMTFNLTHSTFKHERNFALMIDDPKMIEEIENVFNADWQRQNIVVQNSNLVWSPFNARSKILSLINSAHSEIKIYAEGLSDYQVVGALAKAAKRGVEVELLMTSRPNSSDNNKYKYLRNTGVILRFDQDEIIHAKVILVDHEKALLGSINLTKPSLDQNRELSIITSNPTIYSQLEKIFNEDWKYAEHTKMRMPPHVSYLLINELSRLFANSRNSSHYHRAYNPRARLRA